MCEARGLDCTGLWEEVHDGGWETNGQRGCDNRFLHLYSHMRVSVPGIPQAILDASPVLALKSVPEAIQRLTEFIGAGNVALLTGAGVSVDSGIRAYRVKMDGT